MIPHSQCVPNLTDAPWAQAQTRRLPGVQPLLPGDWLHVDAAYAGQMALRDHLISTQTAAVYACLPGADAAAKELYDSILVQLPALGFIVKSASITRPDGVEVDLTLPPLLQLGRLLQCDFCLHLPDGQGQHRLVAAILCFPAGWTLAEKIGQTLRRIHAPIDSYSDMIAASVQRMFDAIRPEQPLWRANAHYSNAQLFNPRPESAPRILDIALTDQIRSERQCFIRLPKSRAVVFSIHTRVISTANLSPAQAAALRDNPLHAAA